MSCCKTITRQHALANRVLQCLDNPVQDDEVAAHKVVKAVNVLRSLLGSYHIDPQLTRRLRTQIEPALCSVYTRAELDAFAATTLRPFGKDVHDALEKWKRRYCQPT